MADIAKFKLVTSLGVILAGEEIPSKLPAKERTSIDEAGGIVAETRSKKSAKAPDDSERKVAELALEDAKVSLAKAETDAEKSEAQKKLEEAEEVLNRLL